MGRSVDEFFKDIEENSEEGKVLPNWCVPLVFKPSSALLIWDLGMESYTSKYYFLLSV